MTEESDTEASSADIADAVISNVEPLGSDEHDGETNTASPWPLRASPYV
jgi:hypothetical protein